MAKPLPMMIAKATVIDQKSNAMEIDHDLKGIAAKGIDHDRMVHRPETATDRRDLGLVLVLHRHAMAGDLDSTDLLRAKANDHHGQRCLRKKR